LDCTLQIAQESHASSIAYGIVTCSLVKRWRSSFFTHHGHFSRWWIPPEDSAHKNFRAWFSAFPDLRWC